MLTFPRYGLGTAPLGNLFTPVTDADAEATVHAALAAGWTYLDTAPHYGVGLAEERLGRALRGVPRETYLLSTKVGRLLEPGAAADGEGFVGTPPRHRRWDFSRDGVLRSLEESLTRLGLDRIDMALVHDPDDPEHFAAARREALPALAELRDQGVIGGIGAGMNHVAPLAALVRDLDLDAILLAGRHTLLDHSAATGGLLDLCAARSTAVVIGGVFNSGLLAAPEATATFDYAAAPPEVLDRARRMAEVCAAYGTTLPAAALRFPFGHPAVASVLVGCRSAAEVAANAASAETKVPAALWDELRAAGLLPPEVPTPDQPRP
jgi:D-threo-aldose 1-dehydrogenase